VSFYVCDLELHACRLVPLSAPTPGDATSCSSVVLVCSFCAQMKSSSSSGKLCSHGYSFNAFRLHCTAQLLYQAASRLDLLLVTPSGITRVLGAPGAEAVKCAPHLGNWECPHSALTPLMTVADPEDRAGGCASSRGAGNSPCLGSGARAQKLEC